MAELIALEPEAQAADLIAVLDDARAKVEAGEISSIAIAFVYRNGDSNSSWSGLPNRVQMLGSIYRLAHKLQLFLDEG